MPHEKFRTWYTFSIRFIFKGIAPAKISSHLGAPLRRRTRGENRIPPVTCDSNILSVDTPVTTTSTSTTTSTISSASQDPKVQHADTPAITSEPSAVVTSSCNVDVTTTAVDCTATCVVCTTNVNTYENTGTGINVTASISTSTTVTSSSKAMPKPATTIAPTTVASEIREVNVGAVPKPKPPTCKNPDRSKPLKKRGT